jgi:hypothetical protein
MGTGASELHPVRRNSTAGVEDILPVPLAEPRNLGYMGLETVPVFLDLSEELACPSARSRKAEARLLLAPESARARRISLAIA